MTDRPDAGGRFPEDDWAVLSVPVGEPPDDVVTEEDEPPPPPAVVGSAGPPGGRVFSIEDRPAPSLYLLGWLLSGAGLAMLAVALLAGRPELGPSLASGGIIVLGVGLALAAGYQLVARGARPVEGYRGPSPLILFGLVLCVSTVASIAAVLVGRGAREPLGFILNLSVIGLSYLGVVWLFVVRGGALRWREMGWPGWRAERPFGLARFAGDIGYALVLILPTTLVALLAAGLLARVLDTVPTQVLPDTGAGGPSMLVILGAVVVAPLGEELFFRGFALSAWWRDLGARTAIIRSTIFFALVHVANIEAASFGDGLAQALVQFAAILPLGLVIGLLFVQRGMVAALAAHMSYNGLLLALYYGLRSALPDAPG